MTAKLVILDSSTTEMCLDALNAKLLFLDAKIVHLMVTNAMSVLLDIL